MADALLIEIGGDTAGIVVQECDGFRFFASDPAFYALDGLTFETVGRVHAALRPLRFTKPLAVKARGLQPAA